MKYALLLFSVLFTASVQARSITSFKDSYALLSIAQFMSDAKEDLPHAVLLSDKKINIKDASACVKVSSADVIEEATVAIKKVLRFYPDEELPIDEALSDLEDYLDNKSFKRCLFEKTTKDHLIKTTYFMNAGNSIHLRVDNITLLIDRQ